LIEEMSWTETDRKITNELRSSMQKKFHLAEAICPAALNPN